MSVLGRRLRSMATAMAACALVTSLASCGDDSDATADETTTSTSETTIASTTTTQDLEAEVEAAYLAYWEMNKRLVQSPDPDDPEITERTTGSARSKLVDSLTTMRAEGSSFRFGPLDSIDIIDVEVAGDTAAVHSCAVGDATRVDDSGEQRIGLSTSRLETEMTLGAQGWVVTTVSEADSWKGATECDA